MIALKAGRSPSTSSAGSDDYLQDMLFSKPFAEMHSETGYRFWTRELLPAALVFGAAFSGTVLAMRFAKYNQPSWIFYDQTGSTSMHTDGQKQSKPNWSYAGASYALKTYVQSCKK
eukprot:scaffold84241_cov33-Prasinocladus_malaysianus.AAC.1